MEDRIQLLLAMLGQVKPMDGVTEKDTYFSAAWKGYDNAKRVAAELGIEQ